MDYAMDLFIPIIGGLMLAQWLIQHHRWPALCIVIFPVVGLFLGLGLLYKRQVAQNSDKPPDNDDASKP